MAAITYADKSKTGASPANKWRDVDANEVKASINALYTINTALPKVWRGLLSQVGNDAPTAVVLEDTIGDAGFTFQYSTVGVYQLDDSRSKFKEHKTFVTCGTLAAGFFTAYKSGTAIIVLKTTDNAFADRDELLNETELQILVYP